MLYRHLRTLTLLVSTIALAACSSGSQEPRASQVKTVTISWDANNEERVNSGGGGYKVYYSDNSGFGINDNGVTVIDVPYVSGQAAPTRTDIDLSSGTYYIKVVAYTAFPSAETLSEPSSQVSVNVPFK